jgi:hypothetical protein
VGAVVEVDRLQLLDGAPAQLVEPLLQRAPAGILEVGQESGAARPGEPLGRSAPGFPERTDKGRASIEDLGSRHGTFVDGDPIKGTTPLRDGSRIGMGSVAMVFRQFEPTETESRDD